MKKIGTTFYLLVLMLVVFSCQDEFCLDATTPELVIRFYNKDTINQTKPIALVVWANDLDTLYNGTKTDSLSIPLDTQNNSVTYHFSIFGSINTQEELQISYTTKDVFVSKACGYKNTFHQLNINNTNNLWLDSLSVLNTEIINQTQAHVKIFH